VPVLRSISQSSTQLPGELHVLTLLQHNNRRGLATERHLCDGLELPLAVFELGKFGWVSESRGDEREGWVSGRGLDPLMLFKILEISRSPR
jgi:hypothetical protein